MIVKLHYSFEFVQIIETPRSMDFSVFFELIILVRKLSYQPNIQAMYALSGKVFANL